jgi:hypothetical protein
MEIKTNKIGLIVDGEYKGFYIKIVEDLNNTGGYYLLYSKNFYDKTAEGYDEWFFNFVDLINFVSESLTINWIECGSKIINN